MTTAMIFALIVHNAQGASEVSKHASISGAMRHFRATWGDLGALKAKVCNEGHTVIWWTGATGSDGDAIDPYWCGPDGQVFEDVDVDVA